MRLFKIAMLVATLLLATQGSAFDITHMAVNAATKHIGSAATKSQASAPDLPASTGNFGACQQTFLNANPPSVPNVGARKARALCFDGFAVLHSGSSKSPIYAAEVMNRETIADAKGESRTDHFYADARLPRAERAELEDFARSGFDRGHNFPAADAGNPNAMAMSFSLANMMAQAPVLNRKGWAGIESATRKYAARAQGNVYVITGSILLPGACTKEFPSVNQSNCTIGNGVVVPSHIYKLVFDATTRRAWAHWSENSDSARTSAPISYAALVERTGIDFFPGVTPLN